VIRLQVYCISHYYNRIPHARAWKTERGMRKQFASHHHLYRCINYLIVNWISQKNFWMTFSIFISEWLFFSILFYKLKNIQMCTFWLIELQVRNQQCARRRRWYDKEKTWCLTIRQRDMSRSYFFSQTRFINLCSSTTLSVFMLNMSCSDVVFTLRV
jgi:hypothetical protein